jgi:hypothetical protein
MPCPSPMAYGLRVHSWDSKVQDLPLIELLTHLVKA